MYIYFFKRGIDILVSLLILPLVVIEICILGPIIFFTDKGPIFYNGERMGKNGKKFKMFKLRSMYTNSKDIRNLDGSTYSSVNDSRVTPIGRFLRKTSLDEFPQFFNVLIGDMSLVGPRPSLTTTPYSKYSEVRKTRVSVRPGVTGYSQAYFRNSIGQDEKFKYDIYYINNISFMLDIKILFTTFWNVLVNKNINTN
ncbi:MAG: sugar transferase [Bacteroides sp.]|nr:sugar transferase [Bacteroides sp.]